MGSLYLVVAAFNFMIYCLARRIRVDSSAKKCSSRFCRAVQSKSYIGVDPPVVEAMFYDHDTVFWRFWDWSDECCIKDKTLYHKVVDFTN